MKAAWTSGIVVLLAAVAGGNSPAAAQGELGRLESGIRAANGQTVATAFVAQRVYLGAVADDDAGRGVRVLSLRSGGPADRAGVRAQDLVVGAGGRRLRTLAELSAILSSHNPGDRVALELLRGSQPLHVDVVLGAPLGSTPTGQPALPPAGLGAGPTETIPPPPGDSPSLLPPSEGPSLLTPGAPSQPFPPNSPQAQINELQRRVEQLERRVEQLQRALAESQRK